MEGLGFLFPRTMVKRGDHGTQRKKVHAYILQHLNQLVGCGQFIAVWTGMYSVLKSPAEELGSVGKGLLLKRGSDSLAAGKWNCMLAIKIKNKKSAELWPINPLHQAHLIDVEPPSS